MPRWQCLWPTWHCRAESTRPGRGRCSGLGSAPSRRQLPRRRGENNGLLRTSTERKKPPSTRTPWARRGVGCKHFSAGPAPATGWLQQTVQPKTTRKGGITTGRPRAHASTSPSTRRQSNGSLQAKYKRLPLHTQPASLPAAAVRCIPQNSLASFHHSASWKKRVAPRTAASSLSAAAGGAGKRYRKQEA